VLIKELLEELKNPGEKVATIAKRIEGISEKKLANALRGAGYTFSNQAPKGWHYAGDGEEPLEKSIFDYVKSGSLSNSPKKRTGVILNSPKSESEVKYTSPLDEIAATVEVKPISQKRETNVNKDYSALMYDELKAIRGLLQEKKPIQEERPVNSLVERIGELDRAAGKTRKTIVIDSKVAERLDEYAKTKRVNKSDLLEVALLDLFEKYN
jgi:hypothetical protein